MCNLPNNPWLKKSGRVSTKCYRRLLPLEQDGPLRKQVEDQTELLTKETLLLQGLNCFENISIVTWLIYFFSAIKIRFHSNYTVLLLRLPVAKA